MNKTYRFLIFFSLITVITCGLYIFTSYMHTPSDKDIFIRQAFTKLTGLPDLSFYTESPSERFRTFTDAGSVYSNGPFAPDTDFSAIIYKKAKTGK